MIILRLAAGGRVAMRAEDVAIAQSSPWGATIRLASEGSTFEVEHDLTELGGLIPSLWFQGPGLIFNPDHIASIWEDGGALHYRLAGGVALSQPGTDLHQFLATLEDARAQRAARQS